MSWNQNYKSVGLRAMRAMMAGPIMSLSWKAKVQSGQPVRESVWCEPLCRFTLQPMRNESAPVRFSPGLDARRHVRFTHSCRGDPAVQSDAAIPVDYKLQLDEADRKACEMLAGSL
jgi:hypothetical protein